MFTLTQDTAFVQEVYQKFREAFDAADELGVFVSNAQGTEFIAACPGASFGVTVDGDGKVRVEVSSEGRTAATKKVKLATATAPGPLRLTKEHALYWSNLFAPSFEWYFHANPFKLLKGGSEVVTLTAEFLSRDSGSEGLSVTVYIEEPSLTCYTFFRYWEVDDDGDRRGWIGISKRAPLKRLAWREEKGEQA